MNDDNVVSLRLPKDVSLDGRKIAIAARMVVGRQTLFQLKEPVALTAADLGKPLGRDDANHRLLL